MSDVTNWSRREFLAASGLGVGALILGFRLPTAPEPVAEAFAPNAWLSIDPSGTVTIWVGESDMGQGVRTALPQILADELEADWASVRIEQAYPDPKFENLGTGGSSSVRNNWMPLRKAGAAARVMLVAAAAETWGVPPEACAAETGAVNHPESGRSLAYGDLVAAASEQPVPEDPPLKDPKDFRYIGQSMTMLDTPDRVTGQARFGIDVRIDGMKVATVARPPAFGGTLGSFDPASAQSVDGVEQVVEVQPVGPPVNLPGGVAVIAGSTWTAIKGREALEVEWNEGPHAQETTEALRQQMVQRTEEPGMRVRDDGDVDAAFAEAAQTVEATYELPFLAHATMEPQNCTAKVDGDRVEIWGPIQTPTWAQSSVADALGVPKENVMIHTTLLGGGFGRRLNPDVPVEAALVAKAAGVPVQVVWTREDDMRHDFYRPASHHRFRAALDAEGRPTAWHHRLSTPAIQTYLNGPDVEGPEGNEVAGAFDLPYGFPNLRVEYGLAESGVPRGWWRSVEHSFNGFVTNAFIDEVAEVAGQDPLAFRLQMLDRADPEHLLAVMEEHYGDQGPHRFDLGRYRGVLERAAAEGDWGQPLPDGSGRGIAVHWSFLTYCAEVVEVTVEGDDLAVDRVVCAIDCGQVVNPRTLEEQLTGGILNGLMATLKNEITVDGGGVVQGNFDTYDLLRMNEAPAAVDVYPVESTHVPSGAGEPSVPPLAGALAGAIYDATGERIRVLPMRLQQGGKA